MSSGNFQVERKRNFELQKKRVTADYTIKTGTSTYNGVIDNPVCIYNPAANVAITLPDGAYIGQEVLVAVEANTSAIDATVCTLEDAGEYARYLWNGTDWDLQTYEGCSLA